MVVVVVVVVGACTLSMLASTITYPLVEFEFDPVGESEYTNT